MRRMLQPMISPSSLSAFSASVASAFAANRPIAPPAPALIRVRTQGPQSGQPQALGGPAQTPSQGVATPVQILPRGSLLNLSV